MFENAVVYDIENYPNYFGLSATGLHSDYWLYFEISERRNDIAALFAWLEFLHAHKIHMIGFNNLNYDYRLLHEIYLHPGDVTLARLYELTQQIIGAYIQQTIWQSERFAPQIDLFKIHHFDNKAKIQSLKGLQFNMRSPSVEDLPIPPGTPLTLDQIDNIVVPYNRHDVSETKRFAHITLPNIEFRQEMSAQIKGDVLNFNETKIGKELLAQKLGDEVCYTRQTGKREPRQTIRRTIALQDVIFPYIKFQHPEFQRIHQWMLSQTLQPSELEAQFEDARVSTKGVFSDVKCTINGFTFHFGTGGIHGSVTSQHFAADDEFEIIDVDVASLYPSIAIVNRLYPEHLGELFIAEYANLKAERFKYKKGTPQSNALKLALNGTYGASNDIYSPFYDPKFTMAITINGQLMLCMLAEWLMNLPSVQIIQINTDGITFKTHRSIRSQIEAVCKAWQEYTLLELEFADYSNMWIRDVNNYVAQSTKGKVKIKGAYWHADPDPVKYAESISNAGPSAWHKDLSAPIVQKAANAAMLTGCDPDAFIWSHSDPYDFMLRAKAPRGSTLYIGERPVQRITRYYVARQGGPLRKISPPAAGNVPGQFKRKPKITDAEYVRVMNEIGPDVWDARIHTGNRSKYEDREISLQAGWLVAECNVASDFRFDNLNRQWYTDEAKKLIIK